MAAATACLAQAPPPNPVFVNDSTEAARLLAKAEQLGRSNPGESVRLIQEVLNEYPQTLIPHPTESGRFDSSRDMALGMLLNDRSLLRRYQQTQAGESRKLLKDGRLMELAQSRSLTRSGLEALLLLGQEHLEQGHFAVASIWLQEALDHPQLQTEDRHAALLMLGLSAHSQNDKDGFDRYRNLLQKDQENPETWLLAMDRWTNDDPPKISRGQGAFDRGDMPAGELLSPALWSTRFDRSPATINSTFELAREDMEADLNSGRLTAIFPVVHEQSIIINEGADLVRMDLLTGMEHWRTPLLPLIERAGRIGDPIGPTAIAFEDEDVIAWIGYSLEGGTSEVEQMVCLDAETGLERWRYDLDQTPGIENPETLYPTGPPVIHEDRVFVIARRESRQGLKSCYLLALDREHGTPLYLTYIASTGSQYRDGSLRPLTKPVIDGRNILVSTSIGAIASINVATGNLNWVQRMDTPVSGTRALNRIRPYDLHYPVIIGDEIISLSPDYRRIVRLDRNTGARIETMEIDGRTEWNDVRYLLTDGERVISVGSMIMSMDPDALSHPIWTNSPRAMGEGQGQPLAGRVHLAGDRLYVPTGKSIAEIDISTGDTIRRLPVAISAIPVVSDQHLLISEPEGLSLHANPGISDQLESRLLDNNQHFGTHLTLLRIAARTNDRPELLSRSDILLNLLETSNEKQASLELARRKSILDEILSTLDPDELVSDQDHRSVARVVNRLTNSTPLSASAALTIGDWLAKSQVDEAVDYWNRIEMDPETARLLHQEGDVLAPAAHWARTRLNSIASEYPQLAQRRPWITIPDNEPWSRQVATLAKNIRQHHDQNRIGQATLDMLERSIKEDHAADGLAILDLWSELSESNATLPDGRSHDQWRTRLIQAVRPEVPRTDQIGGRARQWSGELILPLDRGRHLARKQRSFLRSEDERLSFHEAPNYDVKWSAYFPHRDASIVHQDNETMVLALEQLGKPARLISLLVDSGDVVWDYEIPTDLFLSKTETEENQNDLRNDSQVAIIPMGLKTILVQATGRMIAVDAREPGVAWESHLPAYSYQFVSPWQHGIAAIGYPYIQANPDNIWDEAVEEASMPARPILTWVDAETGEITTQEIPPEAGDARWIQTNALGDLVIGGDTGVSLFRSPHEGVAWISRGWPLQAHRSRDEATVTARALLVHDMTNKPHVFSLETGKRLSPSDHPGLINRNSLPRITASGDRIWIRYDTDFIIRNAAGDIIGSNVESQLLGNSLVAMAPFSDGMVLLTQTRSQYPFRGSSGFAARNQGHQIQVLSTDGQMQDLLDLFELSSKVTQAMPLEGALLLATDDEIVTTALPPRIGEDAGNF